MPRRSRAGLVRTFQTPQVFPHLTVRENLIAGCYKQTGSGVVANLLGTPRSRREMRAHARSADAACERFGLTAGRASGPPASCPAGSSAWWSWRARASGSRACCAWTSPPRA